MRPALAYLTAVRLVANSGYRFLYPFLPVVARGLDVSLARAGLLVSATGVGGLATPLVAAASGRGGERHRRLAAIGLALFAAGTAVAGLGGSYLVVLVGFGLLGLAKPVYDVAAQAYLSERTAYDRRARVLAVLELTWAGGLLVGAPVAGWLIARAGWQAPLLAFAALGVVALGALPRFLEPDRLHPTGAPARLRLRREGVALLAVMGAFTFGAEVTFVVFGAWLEEDFGLSVIALGGVATLIGVAELVGSVAVIAFVDRVGKRRSVAGGLVAAAAGFAVLPLVDGLAPGLGALAFAILGFEFTIVSAIPLASEVHPDARSRYLSLMVVAVTLPRAAAAAIGPVLFRDGGIGATAVVSAAANVAALVLLVALVRER